MMLKKIEETDTEIEAEFLPSVAAKPKPKNATPAILLVFGAIARGILQILLMIAILFAAYKGMSSLLVSGEKPKKRPVFKTVYTVDTTKAISGNFQPMLTVYGEVVSSRKVDLRALVSGQVTSVNPKLKVGTQVVQGEPLLEIDRFNYEGALSEANANLAETTARIAEYDARIKSEGTKLSFQKDEFELAKVDLDRIRALRKNGTSTQKQVDDRALILSQREWAVSQTQINLEAERAKLAQQNAILERLEWRASQAQRYLADTVLKAPFTGIVSSTQVEVGKMLGANDVVVSIFDTTQLDVRFTLTDQRFGRIQSDKEGVIGRKVDVRWNVGSQEFVFPATIERIGAQIESSRGGVEVFAKIDSGVENGLLRPGAFVEIVVPDKVYVQHFRVPESSIYGGQFTYVVVDGKLAERQVKISSYDGEFALVSEGLESGDEILVTRIAEISEGLVVRTEEQAKAASKDRKPRRGAAFQSLPESEKKKVVAAVLKENGLTLQKWQSMSMAEKGPLIGKQMRSQKNGATK